MAVCESKSTIDCYILLLLLRDVRQSQSREAAAKMSSTRGCTNSCNTKNKRNIIKMSIFIAFLPPNYHKSLLIGPLPGLASLSHRPSISFILARTSFIVILAYSSYKIALSSLIVLHTLFRTRGLRIFQIPLIGLRSSDCGGCVRHLISLSSFNLAARPYRECGPLP
jgi:hypothetical protein